MLQVFQIYTHKILFEYIMKELFERAYESHSKHAHIQKQRQQIELVVEKSENKSNR